MMKTPITVLQELMVKLGDTPQYECIAQTGLQHMATFEYRCTARGHLVTAHARSKKDAKQEAARLMLLQLAGAGMPVPPPYCTGAPPSGPHQAGAASAPDPAASKSYKALLKELCDQYNLPAPTYVLEGDAGPAHARRFTSRGSVGAHARSHTAGTKKGAEQGAAHQLYLYLRENLARLTGDFVEEDALARAHERAMERYSALREDAPWRPDLALPVALYHLGLLRHLGAEKIELGESALQAAALEREDAEGALEGVAAALGLRADWHELVSDSGTLQLLRLVPTSPQLTFVGATRRAAAGEALQYLTLTMRFKDTVKLSEAKAPVP